MTFLQFVVERLMGPPAANGQWICPRHNDHSPSFSVRPHKPPYKDRFRCWGCDWWGDEHDLLKEFYPSDDYAARQARLNALRIDFQQGMEAEPVSAASSIFRGSGSHRDEPREAIRPGNPALVWANLHEQFKSKADEAAAFKLVNMVREECRQNDVTMEELIDYWQGFDFSETVETKPRRNPKGRNTR